MNCNPELVSAYLDGELEPVVMGSMTTHLLDCDDCCRTMSWLAQVGNAVVNHGALWDPEEMTRAVMTAIHNEKTTSARRHLRQRLVNFGVPVALVTALLAGVVQAVDRQPNAQGQQTASIREFPSKKVEDFPILVKGQKQPCCVKKA